MTTLEVMDRLKAEGFNVIHLWLGQEKLPAIVYYETGEDYEFADDTIADTSYNFNIDYYTKKDADPAKEDIKRILLGTGIQFGYKALYDIAKQVIVHSFSCVTLRENS